MKKIFRIIRSVGVSMLEMLLVLAIIAVLLLLATRYYVTTNYTQRVSQLQEEVDSIRAAAANWRLGNPTLSGLNIKVLYNSGYLSKADLDSTQDNAITPWGQNITILQVGSTRKASISFDSSGDDEATKACKAVAANISANLSSTSSSAVCGSDNKFIYTFTP